MSKIIKYILIILAILLLIYFSLDIENLQEHQAKTTTAAFNAREFASRFWEEDLPLIISDAPEVTSLFTSLEENPEEAFERYGHKLGISKTSYFTMKGSGTIESVEDEYLVVSVNERITIRIATDFIFGNAVRDGSDHININEFLNMTDFNNVSVAINKLVKEKVVSRLKNIALPGKEIEFTGAAEIVEDQIILDSLRIIPVKATVSDGKNE